jgi:ribosomal protein L35
MKTCKFATKRLRQTKKGKIMFRPARQNHFNAKQSGNQARDKRGFNVLPKNQTKIFKKVLSR